MIVDASALLAIVFGENEASRFGRALVRARRPSMSSVNFLEAAIRVDQLGDPAIVKDLDRAIEASGMVIVAATPAHAFLARQAYRRFGKGNHPAKLNFADCFAYALAKETGEALLFKGNDFSKTDIPFALA